MSVARTHHNKNYTCMSNVHFQDKNLSLKAKGLLSLMLSLPEEWNYSVKGLASLSSDGETAVRSAVKELEDFGYLERHEIRNNGRIVDWEYDIYEIPLVESPLLDLPIQENLVQENIDNKVHKNEVLKEIKTTKEKNKNDNGDLKSSSFLGSAKTIASNNKEKDVEQYVEYYNEYCTRLPKVRRVTPDRKQKILRFIKEYEWEDIIEVFQKANESDFLTGQNDRGWKANIDFFLRPDKFVSILEGKYGGKKKNFVLEGETHPMTEQERRRNEEWRKEMEKNGKRTTF